MRFLSSIDVFLPGDLVDQAPSFWERLEAIWQPVTLGRERVRNRIEAATFVYELRGALDARRSAGPDPVQLGASLADLVRKVIELLEPIDSNASTCATARGYAIATIDGIDEKIRALSETRQRLVSLLQACKGDDCGQLAYLTPRFGHHSPRAGCASPSPTEPFAKASRRVGRHRRISSTARIRARVHRRHRRVGTDVTRR